jgi:beta-hydroxylase
MTIKKNILPKSISVFIGRVNNTIAKYSVYFTMNEFILVYFVIVFLLQRHKSWKDYLFLLFIFCLSFRTSLRLLNAIIGLYSKNKPIDDVNKYFPHHVILEENFEQIRDEIITFVQDSNSLTCFGDILQGVNFIDSNYNNQKCWKWFTILDHHGFSKESCRELPFLTNLLQEMPEVISASISVLDGQSALSPHRGYYKGLMRYHLGILVPNDHPPVLKVADETYHWKEGEGVIFDDMYIHSVSNPSLHPRIVLFLDILRNDLPPAIDRLNRVTIKFIQGFIAESDVQDHANLKS